MIMIAEASVAVAKDDPIFPLVAMSSRCAIAEAVVIGTTVKSKPLPAVILVHSASPEE
jgi:hypothetical protein